MRESIAVDQNSNSLPLPFLLVWTTLEGIFGPNKLVFFEFSMNGPCRFTN